MQLSMDLLAIVWLNVPMGHFVQDSKELPPIWLENEPLGQEIFFP